MKTTLLSIGLLLVLVVNSCKNKDCKKDNSCPPGYYRFTLEGAKDYLWAKPGSYWIYKNTKTGALDTQFTVGSDIDTFISKGSWDNTQGVTIEYDRLFHNVQSSFDKWIYVQTTTPFSANSSEPWTYRIILRREVWGQGYVECFFLPFDLGVHAGPGSHTCNYIGMDSTLVIQGKTYYNIAKFNIDLDPISEQDCQYIPVTTYYWAKGVGLVKKSVHNCNYSWELIDYNVIQ